MSSSAVPMAIQDAHLDQAGPSSPTIHLTSNPQTHQHEHDHDRTQLSPILSPQTEGVTSPTPEQLRFAEFLTPVKFRRKKVAPHKAASQSQPLEIGPSRLGYHNAEGDLFRGASADPNIHLTSAQLDEDAISISTSAGSTSSSWSWGSGNLERGRRKTMAVIGRVGEALGVRRGSSTSKDSGSDHEEKSEAGSRVRRLSRKLTRTTSNARSDGSPEHPKRQHLPRRREFVLLLPPVNTGIASSRISTTSHSSGSPPTPALYPSERLINTPSLPIVMDHIRTLRLASGMLPGSSDSLPQTSALPVHRSKSGPGTSRAKLPRGHSFLNPPVPVRPPIQKSQSRLDALRTKADIPIRPKSASDLLGLAKPSTSSVNLASLKESSVIAPVHVKKKKKACWWLDVACPSWEDLRDLGELLGLHPLTLEDVLHQDPREKLDTFDKLGYYFVVVRALDEGYFKYTPGTASVDTPAGSPGTSPELRAGGQKENGRRGWGIGRASGRSTNKGGEKVEIVEDNPGKEGLEGVGAGGVNVYLVVFSDGIVSFHFEDISKHTKRVLDRVLSMASDEYGSDWIAHGLLDSIVDAFFPLIRYVDGEVDDIDSLTIDPSIDPHALSDVPQDLTPIPSLGSSEEAFELSEKIITEKPLIKIWSPPQLNFSHTTSKWSPMHLYYRIPRMSTPIGFRYFKLFFLPTSSAVPHKHEKAVTHVLDRGVMLRRITNMRRLVTGLGRLLGTKHQVVARLRNRAGSSGGEVGAYIGDVQDHILLLQTSLNHYEYILSHCQPAYLSHLNVSFSWARGGTDQAILALSTVTISVLPMQVVIGLFSMNIRIPANGDPTDRQFHAEPDGTPSPFNYFAGVVVGIFLIACVMLMLIRYWRWSARRRWSQKRGGELPNDWDGFWGWR